MRRGFGLSLLGVALLSCLQPLAARRLELVWPTPNRAFLEGKPIEAFVQPTASGEVTSGLFGCVRSGGRQFHEGLDLFPIARDARGEATDPIFAAMAGVVRHVNRRAGDSSYGRYIVLEHPEARPAVYTLYAHLSAIEPGIAPGELVGLGQVIATMGRSAGGYNIPKDRAHLHFEIGLRLTDRFESWYRWKKFGNPNEHDVWNGMNLTGLDPLDFYTRFRAKSVDGIGDYLAARTPAVVLRVARPGIPDFVRRYPELQVKTDAMLVVAAGWEVAVDCAGLPFRWRPLEAAELADYRRDEVRIVAVDEEARAECRCKHLVVKKGDAYSAGRDLMTLTQLLFGLR